MFRMNDHTDDLRDTDWRYGEERMMLRAKVFYALSHHLHEHCRQVYEFCNDWVDHGNKNIDNIESFFQEHLQRLDSECKE